MAYRHMIPISGEGGGKKKDIYAETCVLLSLSSSGASPGYVPHFGGRVLFAFTSMQRGFYPMAASLLAYKGGYHDESHYRPINPTPRNDRDEDTALVVEMTAGGEVSVPVVLVGDKVRRGA